MTASGIGWLGTTTRLRGSRLWVTLRELRARLRRDRFQFAIAMYQGRSPTDLHPMAGARNPVLTRRDVADRDAAFVADPFMIRVGTRWHMFFEVLNKANEKGEIGLATSADAMVWRYEGIVLSEPFHLSYPQVLEWNGAIYMLPESYQAEAAKLYQAIEFPYRWSPVATLIEGPVVVDSTVFPHDGRWWMLAETGVNHTQDCLRLFHGPELKGPWTEHPRSPIVEGDPSRSRPAGKVICHDGRLIRLAQICAPEYGTAVRAFEILELTPVTYREREVPRSPILGPGRARWNRHGMHHVDAHEVGPGHWIACVDGR